MAPYSNRRHHGQAFIQSNYGMASAALRKQDSAINVDKKGNAQDHSSEEPRNEHHGSTFVGVYRADANQVTRGSNKLGSAIRPSEKPQGPRGRSSPFEEHLLSEANRQSEVMEEGMPKNVKTQEARKLNEK